MMNHIKSNIYLIVLSVIGLKCLSSGLYYTSNTTDLTKCNVSYSRSGSIYKDFYPVKIQNHTENGSLVLDFHFAVLASSDAHILLAESENISKTDPAYEIVIGAGGNTFCDIRRMQKSDVRHSVRIKGLLSGLDPVFFWLHIRKGGLVEVGREGENTSFINWTDPDPLPVKFISFSTWSGIEAKWYFDCDRSQSIEEIEKRMSTIERLRLRLFTLYNPLIRPVINQTTVTKVTVKLNLDYLEIDEYRSSIEVRGITSMQWKDEKIHWNPSEHDNITHIFASMNDLWKPEISCFNALDNFSNILQDTTIQIDHTGEAIWNPVILVKAFCGNSNFYNWPRDNHYCKMAFGFSVDYDNVLLYFDDSDSSLTQHSASQWMILDASILDFNLTTQNQGFVLNLEVQRSSILLNIVFFVPFVGISTCLLLSFWTPPYGHLKLSLGGSQLILEGIMLVSLAYFIPRGSGKVPFLIVLYTCALFASLLSLITSVVIINVSRKKQPKPLPHVISKQLTDRVVRRFLCLPKIGMPEDYGDLEISLSMSNIPRNEDKDQQYWLLLAIAIDRMSFWIYAFIIVILTIKYTIICL